MPTSTIIYFMAKFWPHSWERGYSNAMSHNTATVFLLEVIFVGTLSELLQELQLLTDNLVKSESHLKKTIAKVQYSTMSV